MRKSVVLLFSIAASVLLSLAPAFAASVVQEPAAIKHTENSYTRTTHPDPHTCALQIAIRSFRIANGSIVSLLGVIHIGDKSFYQQIQKYLDAQQVVLFEGVSKAATANVKPTPEKFKKDNATYVEFANALGLAFQGTEIHYDSANFRHCDMTIEQMRQILENRHTDVSKKALKKFDATMNLIENHFSITSLMIKTVCLLCNHSERLQSLVKFDLITSESETAQNSEKDDPAKKMLDDLIISERNQYVMQQLGKILHSKNPPRTIAIFYGAGHLEGMEKILRRQYGGTPIKTKWLTAVSMDPAQTGLSKESIAAKVNHQDS